MPRKPVLKLDPGLCPKCRSVSTEVLNMDGNHNTCTRRCHSCQSQYIQYFNMSKNMMKDSPDYITDMSGRKIWES